MAPIQNTFSIIPDVPSVLNGHRDDGANGANGASSANARMSRPMTTKQVKKAYQKANKQPRISKAEQRRQELFEQDRIRKELEKERNQARARAARDKKKEKEERERAEKKKKGLPLVDVRPSQDTIARFVRAGPRSQRGDSQDLSQTRRFDEADKENAPPVETVERVPSPPHVACRDDNGPGSGAGSAHLNYVGEPPSKKRRVSVPEEDYEGDDALLLKVANEVDSPLRKPDSKGHVASGRVERPPSPGVTDGQLDVDDGFFIDMSQENLLHNLFRETESVHITLNASGIPISGQQQDQPPPAELPPPKPHENQALSPKELKRLPHYKEQAAIATEPPALPHQATLSSEVLKDTTRALRQNLSLEKAMRTSTPPSLAVYPISRVQKSQPTAPGSRFLRHSQTLMAPPLILPKFKPSKQDSAGGPRTPQFLKPSQRSPMLPPRTPVTGPHHSRVAKPTQVPENHPPPSTQLFILNHLDDFLPSPSQEVREIFEQPREEHTRNWSNAKSGATSAHQKAFKPSVRIPKTLNAPKTRRVNSAPNINTRRPILAQQVAGFPEPPKAAVQPPMRTLPQSTSSTFEMPFFSTQDLLLSSQDVKDIEEDPPPPVEAQDPTPLPPKAFVEQPAVPRHSPKQFFTFSSGAIPEDMRLHQTRKPPDVQGSRSRSNNSETYQRSTRSKGSYEVMLELLAQGPKQRSAAREKHANGSPGGDEVGDGGRGGNTNGKDRKGEHPSWSNEITNEELEAMMMTIPASQETDYDCGEVWDDDDLLGGVV
ncbi:hypothetical protein F5Y14DRAFT_163598 [Nemania sp. NC0429]|nr:hypothetical protein F5Y14DRAFT_163598 [Nemania sp. NC0429]